MKLLSRRFFVILAIFIPLGECASCYYPSRGIASGDTVCQPKADVSACCGPGYACLGNLLCQKTKEGAPDSLAIGAFVRGSCTDQTFGSPSCPQFCRSAGTNQAGGSLVNACSGGGGRYCCAGVNSCDCDTGVDVVTVPGSTSTITVIHNPSATSLVTYTPYVPPTSSSTAVSTSSADPASSSSTRLTSFTASQTSNGPSSSASSTGPASSAGASSPPNPTPAPTSDHSVAIGVGVGVPLGLIAIAVVGWLFWRQRRRINQLQRTSYEPRPQQVEEPYSDYRMEAYKPDMNPHAQGGFGPAEIAGSPTRRQELP